MVRSVSYDPAALQLWISEGTHEGASHKTFETSELRKKRIPKTKSKQKQLERLHRLNLLGGAFSDDCTQWEGRLVHAIAEASSLDQVQGAVNEALLEVDAALDPSWRLYAASSRICVFGCLVAMALVFIQGRMMTVEVVDVFAIATAAVLIIVLAAKQARRFCIKQRAMIDAWIETMLEVRWP